MANTVTVTVAGGMNDTVFGKLQAPLASYIRQFGGIQKPEEELFDKIFKKKKSTHWGEAYGSETDIDDMVPVGESGDYPSTSFQDGYNKTIVNVEYKQSMRISQTAIEDGVLGDLTARADKLSRAYHRGKARLAAMYLGKALGGSTTYQHKGHTFDLTCMDSGPVFSKTHAPKVSGANQSNLYADAFTYDALIAGKLKMQQLKDEDGNTLDINPDTIIIPTYSATLYKAVLAAIGSPQVPGSGNNDVSLTYGNWTVLMSSYLNDWVDQTATNPPWILFDSKFNSENDGNIFQERVPFKVRSELAPNDDNIWKARARYGYGFVNWRQMMAFGMTGGSTL
jgi:hypothetical protein